MYREPNRTEKSLEDESHKKNLETTYEIELWIAYCLILVCSHGETVVLSSKFLTGSMKSGRTLLFARQTDVEHQPWGVLPHCGFLCHRGH